MAVEAPGVVYSFKAAADLSSYQYRLVKISGADEVNIIGATGDDPIGVLQNKPSSAGAEAKVALLNGGGVLKAVSDGSSNAIAAGNQVEFSAAGKLMDTATGGSNNIGVALAASDSDGEIISFLPHAYI